jgi:alpha-tubulin suppressor-like RCC1 family protein
MACGGDDGPTGPPAGLRMSFTVQPTNSVTQEPITPAVQLVIQDPEGNIVATATDTVKLILITNAGGGVLSGTRSVAAVQGVATFADLEIDAPGSNYTIVADAPGRSAVSDPFTIASAFLSFAQVSAGGGHTCAVTALGTAYCWGANHSGQLGDGSTVERVTPVPVAGSLGFASVAAGFSHTCGVTSGGAAYCWGENEDGQLGDGTTDDRSSPVPVAGGVSFAAVSTGFAHTCGVTAAGAAYCWGANGGWLGDGTTTRRLTPTPVSGGLSFAAVSAGLLHSCGVTFARAAYCWGRSDGGALGDNSIEDRLTPHPVNGGLSLVAVSTGAYATCGTGAGGAAYCWGYNAFGQLGEGSTNLRPQPALVTGGLTFTAVSIHEHSCGVTSADLYCWGRNVEGQLGLGATDTVAHRVPVRVLGGLSFASVSAGQLHTCGVTTTGAAYCWGHNGVGQAGDGSGVAERVAPARVLAVP